MNTSVDTHTDWRDYYELTKPRVVVLIVFTAIVGMFLSVPGWPGMSALIFGTVGIGLASSAAAVFNHVLDARTDILMMRTRGGPLPPRPLGPGGAPAGAPRRRGACSAGVEGCPVGQVTCGRSSRCHGGRSGRPMTAH